MNKTLTQMVEGFLGEKIDAMNADELREVVADCKSLTETNCSWVRYGLRSIIQEVAEAQLEGLADASRAAQSDRADARKG